MPQIRRNRKFHSYGGVMAEARTSVVAVPEVGALGWVIPAAVVPLGGDRLEGRYRSYITGGLAPAEAQRRARSVLREFRRLRVSTIGEVVRFCRRYGQLLVNQYGRALPPLEAPLGEQSIEAQPGGGVIMHLPEEERHVEDAAWYRWYARTVDIAVRAAEGASNGRGLSRTDLPIAGWWERHRLTEADDAYDWWRRDFFVAGVWSDAANGLQLAAEITNWWMIRGRVRPFVIDDGHRIIEAWSGGLWGAIGRELERAVRGAVGRPVCTHCHRPAGKQRRAKAGQETWCHRPPCQRARWRFYKRTAVNAPA